MTLTDARRRILVTLSDEEWRLGSDLTQSGNQLAVLEHHGLIRSAGDDSGYLFDRWTITPDGLAELELSQ